MHPHIDYSEVPSVPHKVTLSFINNFVVNTTHFLNKFGITCEKKLKEVDTKIKGLEITLNLLEAKLNSIEGLENVSVSEPQQVTQPTQPDNQQTQTGDLSQVPAPPSSDNNTPAPSENTGLKMKDDPRYSKYFKMLLIGVPLGHVQNKMMMEGADPSILDDPEAPSDYNPERDGEVDFGESESSNSEEEDDDDW